MANTPDRHAITEGLTELLKQRLRKEHRRFAQEVTFYHPECRVDFVAFKPAPYGWGEIGGIEHGTASFYEVKSCMSDYNSGHGCNWYGDENWLVCPIELSMQLRGGLLENRIGILIPVPDGSSALELFKNPVPYEGQTQGWSLHIQCSPTPSIGQYRKHSITEVLAAMVYAGTQR